MDRECDNHARYRTLLILQSDSKLCLLFLKPYTNSSNLHVMIVLHNTVFKEWSVYVWKWLFGTHRNVKTLAASFEKTVQEIES